MQKILSCQRMVSDRFPVASFAVHVPPTRYFEIACATDPALLRPDRRELRTADNFYTSRSGGLLRAPAGQATYLLPADQLKRFAGASRIFYALASYANPGGADPALSIPLDRPELVPSVQLSRDFTGKSLDQRRLGRAGAPQSRYGAASASVLTWGGDLFASPLARGSVGPAPSAADEYDDGFPRELWQRVEQTPAAAEPRAAYGRPEPQARAAAYGAPERPGSHEAYSATGPASYPPRAPAAALPPVAASAGVVGQPAFATAVATYPQAAAAAYGGGGGCSCRTDVEPEGAEDARALATGRSAAPGARLGGPLDEPPGLEDGRELLGAGRLGGPASWSMGQESAGRAPPQAVAAERFGGAEPEGLEEPSALYAAAGAPRFGAPLAGEPEGVEHPAALGEASGRYGAPEGEPPGAEDARGLTGPAYGAPQGEAPGFEDAPDLARAQGAAPSWPQDQGSGRYGQGPAALAPAPAPAGAPAGAVGAPPVGVDPDYDDTPGDEGRLPPPVPSGGPAALTIRKKFELILPVAAMTGGADGYASVAADPEYRDRDHPAFGRVHHGLRFGFVHFSQRSGLLGRVLLACQRRDNLRFREVFGRAADELLQVTNAGRPEDRVRPVDGAHLWEEPWLSRFRAAGKVQAFQAAQNEVAIEEVLDPALGFARALGLDSERALAMLFERLLFSGRRGGLDFILRAVSPLSSDADRDRALAALGHASVSAFQATVPGLVATGRFGPETHAALLAALRAKEGAPFKVPAGPELLARWVEAAKGHRCHARVAALHGDPRLGEASLGLG